MASHVADLDAFLRMLPELQQLCAFCSWSLCSAWLQAWETSWNYCEPTVRGVGQTNISLTNIHKLLNATVRAIVRNDCYLPPSANQGLYVQIENCVWDKYELSERWTHSLFSPLQACGVSYILALGLSSLMAHGGDVSLASEGQGLCARRYLTTWLNLQVLKQGVVLCTVSLIRVITNQESVCWWRIKNESFCFLL